MIVTGIFPDNLKISKVIPLYKAKRPNPFVELLTLLPSISKIFEYVLLEQITNYLLEHNKLSPRQYGFRSNHSTELAALNLVDELTYKLDREIILMNIYIDLSKAFDTLIHEILIINWSTMVRRERLSISFVAIYIKGNSWWSLMATYLT